MLHKIDPEEHGPLGEAMADAVSKCVHCGFCLAACPTYKELGQEADSPRGRIVLMKEVLEGDLSTDDALAHIDPCLGCLACEPACPSGVPYRNLISPFRSLAEAERERSLGERLQRRLVQMTLPYPGRFRLAAFFGRWAKPFSRLMPGSMKTMLDLLPKKTPRGVKLETLYPAHGTKRGRVALLVGCAQSVLDPDINVATINVLNRNGVEVVVPPKQGCCGALAWHVGNHASAQRFASANLQAFPNDVDAIVTNAAGCGSGMHEYGLILKGTQDEQAGENFAHRVIDVSAYLGQLGGLESLPRIGDLKIAYHDACHLANAQNVRAQPRQLLRMIPGVELLEIADAHLCCGSAGTYNIDQPEVAVSLGKQKADNIVATGCDVVAMGNIGCMTQLENQLARSGSSIKVRHTMQVLRDAYESGT